MAHPEQAISPLYGDFTQGGRSANSSARAGWGAKITHPLLHTLGLPSALSLFNQMSNALVWLCRTEARPLLYYRSRYASLASTERPPGPVRAGPCHA